MQHAIIVTIMLTLFQLDDYDRVRAVLKGYICRRRHRAARVQRQRSLELNTDGTHVEGKGSKDF